MPTLETPPVQTTPTSTAAGPKCPLCGSALSAENPNECSHCDWVATATVPHGGGGGFRDRVAVCLSVIPGMGHIYKGHRLTGGLYMLGACFAVFGAIVASTATAGFGILLLPLYWLGVMLQVYFVEDLVLAGKRLQ